MRAAPCVILGLVFLALAGCSTFGKKSQGPNAPARRAAQAGAGLKMDNLGALPPPDRSAPPAGVNGILAGQVLDSYSHRPPATYIQVLDATDGNARQGAPIEVAADGQGYFTIQGLQSGRHYQLIARARDGDHVLAGTTWATPPDPKVLIRISEDYATQNTPAVPNAPWPTPVPAPPSPPPPVWPDRQPSKRAADLGPPVGVPDSAPGSNPRPNPAVPPGPPVGPQAVSPHPENIVDSQVALNPSPPVSIPTAVPPGSRPAYQGPARVPSCVLTGQTLYNFALNDVSGRPWEFRNRRGRLILIDFWGTWCVHCLHAVPHLNILQERYGPYGLQVVGIAYEEGPPAEQVQKVNRVRQRLGMNYQVLMGADRGQCPVRAQFAVANWPTFVLLDEGGRIIWRAEGLDANQMRELEIIIKQRLGVR